MNSTKKLLQVSLADLQYIYKISLYVNILATSGNLIWTF